MPRAHRSPATGPVITSDWQTGSVGAWLAGRNAREPTKVPSARMIGPSARHVPLRDGTAATRCVSNAKGAAKSEIGRRMSLSTLVGEDVCVTRLRQSTN